MSEYSFQFAVLRYVHDPVTAEFINVGVVLYSKEARVLQAKISKRYGRLSDVFVNVNGEHYRRLVNFIEGKLNRFNTKFGQRDLFVDLPDKIEILLGQVLPPDDSSMAFSGIGGGLSSDLEESLLRLFERMVERYVKRDIAERRSNQQVWQVFSRQFDQYDIMAHLSPVTIETPTYKYTFEHAWKNERWHPVEPVSFDLVKKGSILEKANNWIGRASTLRASGKIDRLHLLVGAPSRPELQEAYQNATTNLIENIGPELDLVEEEDAPAFSARFARLISRH